MIVALARQFTSAVPLLCASLFVQINGSAAIPSRGTWFMNEQAKRTTAMRLITDDTIGDLLEHPALAGFSRLLLPWDDRTYDRRMRLQDVGSLLPYHSHVDPATVVGGLIASSRM